MKKAVYPAHLVDPVRIELAVAYVQHELRKLFWQVPEDYWPVIDKNISAWMKSPQLNTPRDFWNGFHGIGMGFKLKIGLLYFVTAENIHWQKEEITLEKLTFGIEFLPTRLIRPGILSAKEVIRFYQDPRNKRIKEEQKKAGKKFSQGTPPRDDDPIIVTEKMVEEKKVLSVYEGNRRLIKAILEEKRKLPAFVGRFTSQEKKPRNYWIPTSILMEILFFAREAFEKGNKALFQAHLRVLKNMLANSESAVYELKERALIGPKDFQTEVLKELG